MINIAIVEDEKKYRDNLVKFIKQYAKEQRVDIEVGIFEDGDEIVNYYSGKFDLILMDIAMQFMDGMSAASEIRKLDDEVVIIFITNMMSYAVKGYQVGAFDYILKPIDYYAFKKSIDRAMLKISKTDRKEYIYISISNGIQKLELNEIYYVESEGHYMNFYTTKNVYRTYMRMKDIKNDIGNREFFLINKGILVNLRYVDGVQTNYCVVNNVLLPISRAKKKEFMEALNVYISRYGKE